MPAAPKSPQSKKVPGGPGTGAPKAKGAVRAKSGCYTCRIRRKKCDEKRVNADGDCETCVRLRLQCLGFGAKRPDWLRESRNVSELRDKIKSFLAAQGLIKGHSGAGPRGADHELPILLLNEDSTPSSSESPPTPTLSLSPSEAPRQLQHESAIRDQREWLPAVDYHDHHGLNPMRTNSPFGASSSHSSHHDTAGMSLYSTQYNSSSSNSIVPWTSARSPYLATSSAPALASSFSTTYHIALDDEVYPYTPLDEEFGPALPGAPGSYIYSILKPGGASDELVNYYITKVVNLQYLLGDSVQIRNIMSPSVRSPGASREAARLLASIHHQRSTYGSNNFTALQDEDIKQRYDELLKVLQQPKFTEDDALAAISVISSFLFDGGSGAWQEWIQLSYSYATSVFRNRDPKDTLQTCSDTTRFIIKASIWFDVLAAITTHEHPRFLKYVRALFSPETSGVYDPLLPPTPELSMMSVMGCENLVVWVLAEVSALSVWKREQQARGSLSIPDLVERSSKLDSYLSGASASSQLSFNSTPTDIARAQSADLFRGATRVYLRSVVSGDFPHVREIADAVEETMALVCEQHLPSSVVRSTVFAFFVCGALTDNPQHREEVFKKLNLSGEDPSSSTVGNSPSIQRLLSGIWADRSKNSARQPVDWRQVLKQHQMLLV